MISAKIGLPYATSNQAFVPYRLMDDQDPTYGTNGTLAVAVGSDATAINAALQAVVDTANYAKSLSVLKDSIILSSSQAPVPVTKPSAQILLESTGIPVAGSSDIPMDFVGNGSSVSSLQFDLTLPSGFSVAKSTAGKSASAAGKTIQFASKAGGVTTFVVAGLNANAIPDGMLLTISIAIDKTVAAGSYAPQIANIVAADPAANTVPLSGVSGQIIVK